MNLGLESLNITRRPVATVDAGAAFANLLGSYMDVSTAINDVARGYEVFGHLTAISATVRRYGCTESLLSLYGDNDITFSVEGIGDKIKSAWEWIKAKLRALWEKICNFFKNLFNANKAVENQANDLVSEVESAIKRGVRVSGQKAQMYATAAFVKEYGDLVFKACGRIPALDKVRSILDKNDVLPADKTMLEDIVAGIEEDNKALDALTAKTSVESAEDITLEEIAKRSKTVAGLQNKAAAYSAQADKRLAAYSRNKSSVTNAQQDAEMARLRKEQPGAKGEEAALKYKLSNEIGGLVTKILRGVVKSSANIAKIGKVTVEDLKKAKVLVLKNKNKEAEAKKVAEVREKYGATDTEQK